MLYNFLISLVDQFSALNVFRYLTFRTGLAVMSSLLIVFIIGGPFIRFIHKKEMPPVSSNPISVNSQGPEVSSGDSVKNLFDGSTMTKEQLKARESLQVVENIKANEDALIKASINDMEESARETKSKFSDGFQISEKNKLAPESQSLIRSKLSDFSKNDVTNSLYCSYNYMCFPIINI